MLDTFITSRVRRKIVVVYAKYPDFKTHVRGLAKLIKEDAGNIQRELKRLEKVGFLQSEKQANTKVYFTNKQFPIFKELQGIVLKSQRAAAEKAVKKVVSLEFFVLDSYNSPVMIQVSKKDKSESTESLIRRFSRKVQQSGMLIQVKQVQYFEKPLSKRDRRVKAIARRERKEIKQKRMKMGLK